MPNYVVNQNYAVTDWRSTWLSITNHGTQTVSASGTADILNVSGSGTCLYFIISASSGTQNIMIDLVIDGAVITTTPAINAGHNRPFSLIGNFFVPLSSTYPGYSLSHEPVHFNNSFVVRRAGSTATSFSIGYRIIGN